jgi:uncharacterized protein
MLRNTFIHIPGIGPVIEHKLWSEGFITWDEYTSKCNFCTLSPVLRNKISYHLEESVKILDKGNYRYFQDMLPASEIWRLYGDLRERTAFVDIETTGLYAGPNSITLIGLFDGLDTKVFIQGINLRDFIEEIKKYPFIVTFNGKRFDVPFIEYELGSLPAGQGHLDIMYPLRKLGYRGGLKSIEGQLGIGRQGILGQVDGFMAVLLWREYNKGNKDALKTLIRYNLEDVVNMQYLADKVYNMSLAKLPVQVAALPESVKYCLDDMPYDEDLLEYLQSQIQCQW